MDDNLRDACLKTLVDSIFEELSEANDGNGWEITVNGNEVNLGVYRDEGGLILRVTGEERKLVVPKARYRIEINLKPLPLYHQAEPRNLRFKHNPDNE